jgi:hypothetical protein
VIEADGVHHVADDDGKVIAGPFESNAAAWRWIDRRSGEPISRKEATSSWFMSKIGTDDPARFAKTVLSCPTREPPDHRPPVADSGRQKWFCGLSMPSQKTTAVNCRRALAAVPIRAWSFRTTEMK